MVALEEYLSTNPFSMCWIPVDGLGTHLGTTLLLSRSAPYNPTSPINGIQASQLIIYIL